MSHVVDLKTYPAFLCAKLDATALGSGKFAFKDKEQLGANLWVAVKIENRGPDPVQVYSSMDSCKVSLRIQFYRNCTGEGEQLFRVDNDHNFLHIHKEGSSGNFSEHQVINEGVSISQLIFDAFQTSEKIIREKYTEIEIGERRPRGALWVGSSTDYQDFKSAM